MPQKLSGSAILSLLLPFILSTIEATAGDYRITDLGHGILPAAINRHGDVTGTVVSPFSAPEAFLRRNGVVTKLGVSGCTEKNKSIRGTALNDRGEATVSISDCGSWLCTQSSLYGSNLLSLLGNSWVSWGTTMNEKNQIAGSYQDRKGTPVFGMARDTAYLRFVPTASNNGGTMVGCAVDTSLLVRMSKPRPNWISAKSNGAIGPMDSCVPATYTGGKAQPLVEQLAAEGDDWVLEGVVDLNDNGEIIGYGTKNGQVLHGFILSPSR